MNKKNVPLGTVLRWVDDVDPEPWVFVVVGYQKNPDTLHARLRRIDEFQSWVHLVDIKEIVKVEDVVKAGIPLTRWEKVT